MENLEFRTENGGYSGKLHSLCQTGADLWECYTIRLKSFEPAHDAPNLRYSLPIPRFSAKSVDIGWGV